ncbi:MAG: aldehyde dehydrogenase [Alistipes sp.]|nr:aldehyde dehydrogenase [Alistipes sp.]
MLDVFVELGRRFEAFGKDDCTAQIVAHAASENEWFSESDILMAVDAIRQEYLSREKLERWLAQYDMLTPKADLTHRRVAIVMAGNIPLVGFFDLMCVLLCGHAAYLKPSHKDKVLTDYVVAQLRSIAPDIAVYEYSPSGEVDMVIATGGDAAATHFRMLYPNCPTLIRGSRHSVAVLDGAEREAEIEALHRDIFSYNGLGCRNVSLIFMPRGCRILLHQPAQLNPMYKGNYLSQRALMLMQGVEFDDLGFCTMRCRAEYSDAISCINYAYYDDIAEVQQWLNERDSSLQCVVSNVACHPRVVPFGRAQYPSLDDYADGVDVIEFLTR